MKRFQFLPTFAVFTLCLFAFGVVVGQKAPSKYVLIGYVGSGRWTKEDIEANKLTHINYAFAVPAANGELAPLRPKDEANLAALHSLKAANKDLKILISIGGWGGCKYFSDVALTDASRKKFAASTLALLKKHRLDGIDIDWEYPDQIGDNNIFRPVDKQNFTLLLKELREQLDAQGKQDRLPASGHYLLTAATGGDTAFVNHTELRNAQKYLDYVNIMTYDLYHGNDKKTGHHSSLYQSALSDRSRNSSDDAVDGHIKAGVPASKIVLGLPFYGRGWTDVNPTNNGLFQPSAGKHMSPNFHDLVDNYINKNGFTRYWDEQAKSPYLWNPQSRTFISYADEESLRYKIDYVKSKGLAGAMFWEYTLDKDKRLLNTLVKGLAK
ncbi:glycoside hydrolase family 18 protein [Larkinella soli]|uniref:glycoside hydrolase family 18 protein n=1 Tax=Larkinella soli TaxID=1770527 RepID=UPI000FFCC473|nr:glycoside hydrolase family 18 protein [Larkinella soli]